MYATNNANPNTKYNEWGLPMVIKMSVLNAVNQIKSDHILWLHSMMISMADIDKLRHKT